MKKLIRLLFLTLLFIPPLFIMLVGYLYNRNFFLIAAAAALAFLVLLEFLILRRKTSPFFRAALALAVGLAALYTANYTKDCSRILPQEGVRPVLLYGTACRPGAPCAPGLHDPYDLVLAGGSTAGSDPPALFVTHGWSSGSLAKIPLADPAAFQTLHIPVAHTLAYIPETDRVIAPGWRSHRVSRIVPGGFRVEKVSLCRNKNFVSIDYVEAQNAIYLLSENNALTVTDPQNEARSESKGRFFERTGLLYEIRVSPALGRFFVSSWVSGHIHSVSLGNAKDRRRVFYPPCVAGLAVDEAGRRLFAAWSFQRWILVLDPETLALRRKIRGGFGVRDLEYVPERDWLLATNDFEGTVDVIDVKT
ncbi:MAG: hypothetical protein ABIH66_02065, partial [bacterium]